MDMKAPELDDEWAMTAPRWPHRGRADQVSKVEQAQTRLKTGRSSTNFARSASIESCAARQLERPPLNAIHYDHVLRGSQL